MQASISLSGKKKTQDLAKSIPSVLIHKDEMTHAARKCKQDKRDDKNIIFNTTAYIFLTTYFRLGFQRLVSKRTNNDLVNASSKTVSEK